MSKRCYIYHMESKVLQQDHQDLVTLCKGMTPEERLVAFFNHSRLVNEVYQAGVSHREHAQVEQNKINKNEN